MNNLNVPSGSLVGLKFKTFTGSTPAVAGTSSEIPHGIDVSKIYSFSCIVFSDTETIVGNELALYPPNYFVFSVAGDNYYITVDTAENSGGVINKPYRAIIWYEG